MSTTTKTLLLAIASILGAAGAALTHDSAPRLSDDELRFLEAAFGGSERATEDIAREIFRQQQEVLPAYRDLYEPIVMQLAGSPAFERDSLVAEARAFYDDVTVTYPMVARVDFPSVVVRQAIWDESAETLLFALEPRKAGNLTTTFRVVNIPTNYVARLEQEGRQIAAIDEHGQASGARVTNLGPGEIEVTTTLDGETRFAVRPE